MKEKNSKLKIQQTSFKKLDFLFMGLLFFCIGFVLNIAVIRPNPTSASVCLRQSGVYTHINPLLLCDSPEAKGVSQYTSLQKKIGDLIKNDVSANLVQTVSVYFRNLNKGEWVGINENDQYSPASLLKVPIMISYYKLAESDPSILNKIDVYDGSFNENANETFVSPYDIKPGAYKVDDLIKAMIVNSDNNALTILSNNIDERSVTEIFTDLGLPVEGKTIDFMSAKSYSQFFRILYNSTYLDQAFSEKALALLSGPDFPQGLRAGVPDSVTIAQKFGERTVKNQDGTISWRELHNCGIIYYPEKPYLLCVMTKGTDYQNLATVIQGISKLTYDNAANL